ncbi:MAG: hypothetical protein ACLQVA_00150 [Candidatus Brocadiia bacterium]
MRAALWTVALLGMTAALSFAGEGPQVKEDSTPVQVKTLDGKTYDQVRVISKGIDTVLLGYADGDALGAVRLSLDALSDETRKGLGLRIREEQKAYLEAQAQKGLVRDGEKWVTAEEKKKREEDAAAVKAAAERAAKDKAIAEKRRAAFEAKLTELVPDWKQITAKPGFQQFLQGKTADSEIAKTNITYGMLYQKAFDKGDAAGAAWVFEEWRDNEKELLKSSVQGVPSRGGY